MKRIIGVEPALLGGALVALMGQPSLANNAVITDVQINRTGEGLEIVLETEGGDAANVFAVNQGNTLRADIVRTQLSLPDGQTFRQDNPAPGIAAVEIAPLDANSVRLTIESTEGSPSGEVASTTDNRLVFNVQTGAAAAEAPTVIPSEIETVPDTSAPNPAELAQAEPPVEEPAPTVDEAPGEAPEEAPVEEPAPLPETNTDILVPNPEVVIDGVPVPTPRTQQAPPLLPRAIAPPIGDIAVAEAAPTFSDIDLGSNERIPKLVLRNAPSREVLSLLARAAGLNLVFTADTEEGAAAEGGDEGPAVTLDIENESVQDVFNHVLRVSGLDANRVGRTIYVGPVLPISAQSVSVRTLRLNQVDAQVAANFLVALGAESAVSRERLVTTVNAVEVGEGVPPITETASTTVDSVETQRVDYEDSQAILRGLQVIADERTNSVTLVGQPALVAMATEQLTRIDIRRRQVAVNVRVIDVNLNALDAFGTSFSFSVGDVGIVQNGGVAGINFGNTAPAGLSPGVPSTSPITPRGSGVGSPFNVGNNFLFQLYATVQNGNAKILTDPTLIVQEGQSATVALTEDVITNITETTVFSEGGSPTVTREVEIEPAGLILQIDIDRIDDNGFVSLSVAPSISAPSSSDPSGIVFLARRSLSSGLVRVRDGQTLLLSGIIQESERTSVSKVPILGDLPIIGALFRSTVNNNERQELIVLLTPEIIDDSDQSAFGYSYTPSEDVQDILERSR